MTTDYRLPTSDFTTIRLFDYALTMSKSEQKKPKMLLHACCGVCSAFIPELLKPDFDITIYYENSNIYPAEEFRRRADAAKEMADHHDIPFIEAPQRPADWYKQVRGHANAKERGPRCEHCILFRIDDAFAYAKEHDFDIVACTLSVGRAKDSEMVNRIGRSMSQKYGIPFLDRDWKKGGGEERSQKIAKEKEIYRQDYCGCVYSKRDRDERLKQKSASKIASIIIALGLMTTIASGCGTMSSEGINGVAGLLDQTSEVQEPEVFAWKDVAPGIERASVAIPQDEWQAHLILYRFDPEKNEFKFLNDSENPKHLSEWSKEIPADFLINGFYFHEDFSPSGRLNIDGEDQGSRSFDPSLTGTIVINDGPEIIDTIKESIPTSSRSIAQSYPFLVKDGKNDIEEDSQKVARRSFIGTDEEANIILGVLIGGEISLYEMAEELIKLPIKWKRVLNLDGGTSTGFSSKIAGEEEIADSYGPVPSIIYVRGKE